MNKKYEKGDILQININHPVFPGFFLVVTEPIEWGVQGYLLSSRDFQACKFQGKAYLRVKFEEVEYCGKVAWLEDEYCKKCKNELVACVCLEIDNV